jgi:hypothetical protein
MERVSDRARAFPSSVMYILSIMYILSALLIASVVPAS